MKILLHYSTDCATASSSSCLFRVLHALLQRHFKGHQSSLEHQVFTLASDLKQSLCWKCKSQVQESANADRNIFDLNVTHEQVRKTCIYSIIHIRTRCQTFLLWLPHAYLSDQFRCPSYFYFKQQAKKWMHKSTVKGSVAITFLSS